MKDNFRIAHVLNYLGIGGLELGVLRQSILLSKQGFEVTIICFKCHEDFLPAIPDNIKIVKLDRRAGFDCRLIFRLRSILKKQDYHILHSHNWGTFLYSVLAAKLAGVPVVIHGEHGRESEEILFSKKRVLMNKMLFALCDRMTTVSKDIAEDWKKQNVLSPWRIAAIENGIDLSSFRLDVSKTECRMTIGLPMDKIIIGTVVGLIRPVKDLKTLILAFHSLMRQHPHLHLAMVGYGDDIESLQLFAAKLGVKEHVTFLGKRKDIQCVLQAMDIYVNSSLYEGMSNTLLEAMAMAKPVVATRVGGTPYIIEDGWNGLLVPCKSPEKLAHAIDLLLNDEKLAAQLGANGRQAIESRHNVRQTIYAYAHLYSSSYSHSLKKESLLKAKAKNVALQAVCPFVHSRKQRIKPGLHVLTSHQVVPFDRWFQVLQPSQAIPRETFEREVLFLLENARPIGAEEMADRLGSRYGFDEPLFSITFDDGYKDVVDYAFPFLRDQRVPFFIFLVAKPFIERQGIWCNDVFKYVHALFHQDAEGWMDFSKSYEWFFSKNGYAHSLDINGLLKQLFRDLNLKDADFRDRVVDDLRRRTNGLIISDDMKLATPEEMQIMLNSGLLTVGSHSMQHLYLDCLQPKELEYEVVNSKDLIEETLNIQVTSLAYPWGRFNDACQELSKRVGYHVAFTTIEGSNHENANPYALKRKDAGYLTQDLVFSRPKALIEMNGLADILHR
ncbi:glycosyltransferase [candidate division KSB1 bacterium]|nr:glycosyltransferase [candidate division KSB1 bacterium]RQW11817.1 MAG: glycosyltransferase [candidate division KSB1 bacterium]